MTQTKFLFSVHLCSLKYLGKIKGIMTVVKSAAKPAQEIMNAALYASPPNGL